jgi:hypothetical protein
MFTLCHLSLVVEDMYVVLNEEVPIQANCIEVHFLKT